MFRGSVQSGLLITLLTLGVMAAPAPAQMPISRAVDLSLQGRLSEDHLSGHPEWRAAIKALSVESRGSQQSHECPYEEDSADSREIDEQDLESLDASGLPLIHSIKFVLYPPAISRMLGLPAQCGQRHLVELDSTCLRC